MNIPILAAGLRLRRTMPSCDNCSISAFAAASSPAAAPVPSSAPPPAPRGRAWKSFRNSSARFQPATSAAAKGAEDAEGQEEGCAQAPSTKEDTASKCHFRHDRDGGGGEHTKNIPGI